MKRKKDKTFYIMTSIWFAIIIVMFLMIVLHFNDKPSLFKTLILILCPLNLILAMMNATLFRKLYD